MSKKKQTEIDGDAKFKAIPRPFQVKKLRKDRGFVLEVFS